MRKDLLIIKRDLETKRLRNACQTSIYARGPFQCGEQTFSNHVEGSEKNQRTKKHRRESFVKKKCMELEWNWHAHIKKLFFSAPRLANGTQIWQNSAEYVASSKWQKNVGETEQQIFPQMRWVSANCFFGKQKLMKWSLMYKTLKWHLSICSCFYCSIGSNPIREFRMIERHYFREKLLKSFDFDFGFCIPGKLN